jgi:hypothetical protein
VPLLHLSVGISLVGIVIIFHTTGNEAALTVDITVGSFTLAGCLPFTEFYSMS